MAIENGDILRATAKMSIGEDDVQNVYHLICDVTGDPNDEDVYTDVANKLDSAYDFLVSSVASTVSFDTIELWNLTQDELIDIDGWPTLDDGGNGTSQMPPQTSALVLFNTHQARSQGRKFLPPFGVTSQDPDGSVIAASLANILSFATLLLTTVSGDGFTCEFGNWNKILDRFVEWASTEVRDIFATQRRRYLGSGS